MDNIAAAQNLKGCTIIDEVLDIQMRGGKFPQVCYTSCYQLFSWSCYDDRFYIDCISPASNCFSRTVEDRTVKVKLHLSD